MRMDGGTARPGRPLLVGADIGGTATRVGVADTDGHLLCVAAGGPGNPNSVGLSGSAAQIRTVIAEALHGVTGTVVSVVVGLAGGSRAAGSDAFRTDCVPAEVGVRAEVVSDLSVAFAAATPERDGYVLVAGTGAVAGHLVDDRLVERRDGWGWLLGDEGSGFWLGREAVRHALAALDGFEAMGGLAAAVLAQAGAADFSALVHACYTEHPTWLAGFAPLVTAYADTDPAADAIATCAAALLGNHLASLRPVVGRPVVLAGSVLVTPGPVARRFRTRAASRWPNPLLEARHGVVGALWIAARRHGDPSPEVHSRLLNGAHRLSRRSTTGDDEPVPDAG